jgi:transposase
MVMRVYTPEFRADAVALYLANPSLTLAQVARDLGMDDGTLSRWVHAERDRAQGGPRTTKERPVPDEATTEQLKAQIDALRRENTALRKDNATLAQERDILRKATKYFASEMTW